MFASPPPIWTPARAAPPPLDAIPTVNLWGAYGLQRLLTTWSGPLLRIRRSSDNAELDIGFDASNRLDQVALLAFVGANDGLVVKWYDQSGFIRDLVQPTAANQPKLVTAGVPYKEIRWGFAVNNSLSTTGFNFPSATISAYFSGRVKTPIWGGNGSVLRIFTYGNYYIEGYRSISRDESHKISHFLGNTYTKGSWNNFGSDNEVTALVYDGSQLDYGKSSLWINGVQDGGTDGGGTTGAFSAGVVTVGGASSSNLALDKLVIFTQTQTAGTSPVNGTVAAAMRPVPTGLNLDGRTAGLWGAWSLRKELSQYAGPCLRVRRSNDNAELDIGFSGTALDTGALLAFCGANNGFVVRWYDQSGGGNDFYQATAANQYLLVSAGVYLGWLYVTTAVQTMETVNVSNGPAAVTVFFKGYQGNMYGSVGQLNGALITHGDTGTEKGFRAETQANIYYVTLSNNTGTGSGYVQANWAVQPAGGIFTFRADLAGAAANSMVFLFSGGVHYAPATGYTNSGTKPTGNLPARTWKLPAAAAVNNRIQAFIIYETALSDANIELYQRDLG